MALWPLTPGPMVAGDSTHIFTAATNTGPVTVTASATPHTKGAWVDLIASTAAPTSRLLLLVSDSFTTATNTSCLMDVGIGGAGSEIVIINNLGVGYCGSRAVGVGHPLTLPVSIPAGTRIALRVQSVVASRTVAVSANLFDGRTLGSGSPAGDIETYGANTGTSRGVGLTAGSAHVKGSWTQIVAATVSPIRALLVCHQGNGSAVLGGNGHLIDIGVGAGGSESVIAANLYYAESAAETIFPLIPDALIPLSVPIPAGTRLAARHQCTAGADATLDVILYGIR